MEVSFVLTDQVTRYFPTVRVEKIHFVELESITQWDNLLACRVRL